MNKSYIRKRIFTDGCNLLRRIEIMVLARDRNLFGCETSEAHAYEDAKEPVAGTIPDGRMCPSK